MNWWKLPLSLALPWVIALAIAIFLTIMVRPTEASTVWCGVGTEDIYCADERTRLPLHMQSSAVQFQGALEDYSKFTHADSIPVWDHSHICPDYGRRVFGLFMEGGHLHAYLGRRNWLDYRHRRLNRCP